MSKKLRNLEDNRKAGDDEVGEANRHPGSPDDPQPSQELRRYCTMDEGAIVNGHSLKKGTVIELNDEEVSNHRARGVPLDDVHPEDNREVYSVREPYEAKEPE